jgi:hypothetical protein
VSRLLPEILRLSPSAMEEWVSCERRYLLHQMLGLAPSDQSPPSDLGLQVHELLRFLHEGPGCHDEAVVDDVLRDHGADAPATRLMMQRHRERCPSHFDAAAHEVDRARYHHRPPPMFLATARIDSIFVHDGIFDMRDFKTGGRAPGELRDDIRALVQVWVWAPRAEARGARMRLRYEYLSPEVDDDPDPWEPDADDVQAAGDRIRKHAEAIRHSEFVGVADEMVCGRCPYRSVCSDSAAPGEPSWPVLSLPSETEPE